MIVVSVGASKAYIHVSTKKSVITSIFSKNNSHKECHFVNLALILSL